MTGENLVDGALGQGPHPLLHVVDETDGYTSSVSGVTVEAVRVGRGIGPNTVLGVPGERLSFTSSQIGIPMSSRSRIPDDRLVAAYIHEAAPGSRWCGIPLEAGSVIVYGPGAEHVAINRVGLWFSFAITQQEGIGVLTDQLQVPVDMPGHGAVLHITPSEKAAAMGTALDRLASAALRDDPLGPTSCEALSAFVGVLAGDTPARHIGCGKRIDSRRVVGSCIDYAEAIDHIPSMSELCIIGQVSERRLRGAFSEEFDQSPTRFFRAWALDRAHRRLRDSDPSEHTVTEIAYGLGLDHLSRFAGHYKRLYAECPSTTLRTQSAA